MKYIIVIAIALSISLFFLVPELMIAFLIAIGIASLIFGGIYVILFLPDEIEYRKWQAGALKRYALQLHYNGYYHRGKPIEDIEKELWERVRTTGKFC